MSVANGGAIVDDMAFLVLSDRLVGLWSVDSQLEEKVCLTLISCTQISIQDRELEIIQVIGE